MLRILLHRSGRRSGRLVAAICTLIGASLSGDLDTLKPVIAYAAQCSTALPDPQAYLRKELARLSDVVIEKTLDATYGGVRYFDVVSILGASEQVYACLRERDYVRAFEAAAVVSAKTALKDALRETGLPTVSTVAALAAAPIVYALQLTARQVVQGALEFNFKVYAQARRAGISHDQIIASRDNDYQGLMFENGWLWPLEPRTWGGARAKPVPIPGIKAREVYELAKLVYEGRVSFDAEKKRVLTNATREASKSTSSASKEQLSEERPVAVTVQKASVVPRFRVYIPLFLSVGASAGTTIAREGDTVRMGIPSNSAVEFFFEADRATVPPGATTTWYVNKKSLGSSLESQVFSAGQHRVELAITRRPDTAMSTPATTSETERAGVTLDLIEHSQHVCPGRLGRSCSGPLPGEERRINPLTHVGHYQVFGRVRVAAEVSVGAIKHDACCAKRGWKFGHMCELLQVNVSPTERACEAEWEEAKDDWRRGLTWLGEWVYQGERLVSSRTLAPPGALLQDKPDNAKYCDSGRAESSGRDGVVRCSGQIPIPPWAEDSRAASPDGLHVVQWTKADGTIVTNVQTGLTTRIPFERFPQRILTPHVESQWWFSYWDAGFRWADSGRQVGLTRCSVDGDKPPCAVFLYDLDIGGSPRMVAEELVIGAHMGPAPLGFADKKLIFRGSGEVSTIYEYDPKNGRYRPLVNLAVGGAELSPDRNRIAYFAGDDLLVFHLGTASTSVVVRKVSSLSGMSEEARLWTVAWRSPNQLEFMNVNDTGQTRREVDVTGTKLRQKR